MSEQAVMGGSADISPLDCDLALPLVLDLDGTLVATDTLHKALLLLFKRDWAKAWQIPLWALKGRAVVKQKLAQIITDEDIGRFPINPALRDFAAREAGLGRAIVLATAADRAVAEKVERRFSFISKIIASDGRTNMRGRAKAQELRRLYPNGFIYAGDSYPDIHVWRHSSGAVFAGTSSRLVERACQVTDIVASFPRQALSLNGLRQGLRLHQWAKNALILSRSFSAARRWMPLHGFMRSRPSWPLAFSLPQPICSTIFGICPKTASTGQKNPGRLERRTANRFERRAGRCLRPYCIRTRACGRHRMRCDARALSRP